MIRIWTRGQILPQKSKFSELPKNKWVCSPRRHEPNAIRFVSNGRRERKLSRSVRIAKQVKKCADWAGRTATWQGRTVLTWQKYSLRGRPYRTRGGTRACHVSHIFGIFGMHFDQLEGDTCHHWMGDTWHQGDVSSASVAADVATVLTWQWLSG
jgi:hypothetical protein